MITVSLQVQDELYTDWETTPRKFVKFKNKAEAVDFAKKYAGIFGKKVRLEQTMNNELCGNGQYFDPWVWEPEMIDFDAQENFEKKMSD